MMMLADPYFWIGLVAGMVLTIAAILFYIGLAPWPDEGEE